MRSPQAVRPPRPPRPPLERPRACVMTGTAAALARHLGAPVGALRALFVVLAVFGGAGILLYLWCWAFTPWEVGVARPSRSAPVAWILIAVSAVSLLVTWLAFPSFALPGWEFGTPARIVGGFAVAVAAASVAGVWAGHIDRRDPERGPRAAWTQAAAVLLLLVAMLTVVAAGADPWVVAIGTLVPAAAMVLVLSSTLIDRWRELSGERVARIREEQRAAMAAHLHDSVLQTLALIQNRAGASSEASRLARAQERELRAWLYDGDQPADSDLATDIRDYAGALELDYPVRIDIVSAGLSTERASGELAAATREALLNAARHAGGDVSVYIEGRASGVDVFVRDRGAGFAPAGVPADRLGIRESITGRMRRAGGSATIRSGETGTEVHLFLRAGDDSRVSEGDTRG